MVGGAAYYAGKKVEQGRERDADMEYRMEELEAQQAAPAQQAYAPPPPPAPSAPGAVTPDALQQLEKLAELKDRGVLSDEEFEVQKRRILGTA
jgi:BMFP domain-containing protein YqiC